MDPRMLSAKFREENGVHTKVQAGLLFSSNLKDRLIVKYETCEDAWRDMLYWTALLYGDWYANTGAHTVMYYFFQYLWERAPEWISLCVLKSGAPWSIEF